MSTFDREQELRTAIKNSIDANLPPGVRREWFDLVRVLHAQRSQEEVQKREASFL